MSRGDVDVLLAEIERRWTDALTEKGILIEALYDVVKAYVMDDLDVPEEWDISPLLHGAMEQARSVLRTIAYDATLVDGG